jgi:hypothetical protein
MVPSADDCILWIPYAKPWVEFLYKRDYIISFFILQVEVKNKSFSEHLVTGGLVL